MKRLIKWYFLHGLVFALDEYPLTQDTRSLPLPADKRKVFKRKQCVPPVLCNRTQGFSEWGARRPPALISVSYSSHFVSYLSHFVSFCQQ
jgi:hypothetical protein